MLLFLFGLGQMLLLYILRFSEVQTDANLYWRTAAVVTLLGLAFA